MANSRNFTTQGLALYDRARNAFSNLNQNLQQPNPYGGIGGAEGLTRVGLSMLGAAPQGLSAALAAAGETKSGIADYNRAAQRADQERLDRIEAANVARDFQANQAQIGRDFTEEQNELNRLNQQEIERQKRLATLKAAQIKTAADAKKDQFGQEDKLRDDHRTESKEFVKLRNAYGKILDSVEKPTAASDISLIFNYMRMLDPSSTVRESEYATAANAGGVDAQVKNIYNSLIDGTFLTEEQRQNFANEAGKLYSTAQLNQQVIDDFYTGLATRQGLDVEDVIINYGGSLDSKIETYNNSINTNNLYFKSPTELSDLAEKAEKAGDKALEALIEAELLRRKGVSG